MAEVVLDCAVLAKTSEHPGNLWPPIAIPW